MSKKSIFTRAVSAVACASMLLTGITSAAAMNGKYYSSYPSLDAVRAASREINQQIGEESVVLMKNANNTLPLEGVKFISVFGKAAEDPFYAGGGSGTAAGYYPDEDYTSVYQSLELAGYSVNPALRAFYEKQVDAEALESSGFSYSVVDGNVVYSGNRASISEVNPTAFTDVVLDSYSRYGDAAVVVLGRTGSEGGDKDMGRSREAFIKEEVTKAAANGSSEADRIALEAALETALDTNPAFAASALRHGLSLTWEEQELIKHVTSNFETVIIVLNSPEQIELGWVEDNSLGDIDACMWVGHPGLNGFTAIGEVMNGTVNPSGRLVDIWASDMTKDPTYYNIMENLQTQDGTSDYVYTDETGTDHLIHAIEYEEGIYYGYRYYETAAAEGFIDYDTAVVYPFGHGLSFTTFDKTLEGVEKKTDENGDVYYEVTVKVTNTGDVSGKEVVEVYYTAPYTPGGIEKAEVVLGAFDKTQLLKPGQSETVTLTIYQQDMASYDYSDANKNGHTGYELDAGTYAIKLMENSHDVIAQVNVEIGATNYDTDRTTGADVDNLFSSTTDASYNSLYVKYDENGNALYDGKGGLNHDMVVMSRADFAGTFPTAPVVTVGQNGKVGSEGTVVMTIDADTYADTQFAFTAGSTEDEANAPWYDYLMSFYTGENGAATWTQGKLADPVLNLSDMTGKSWDDPAWVTFLNQMSWEQISNFLCYSGYWSISLSDELARRKNQSLESNGVALIDGQTLGVPFTEQADGPVALKRQNTGSGGYSDVGIQWTSTMNIAATWNTELARIRGIMVGEEALALELDGWYGVAMNIHRSPWGGRNFEYFSEDPLLSGKISAAEVQGVQSKGVVAFIKHFAVNHQDTDRGPGLPGMVMPGTSDYGLVTFVDEQTIREVYTKSFQLAVEEGGALGLMNSMNHIGLRGNSNNFNLMTGLLRQEWGFGGYTVTDIVPATTGSSYADCETMVRIGADLPLNANSGVKVQGDWDSANNCVVVTNASGNDVRNDVVWAAVRMAAKRVMFVNANSSAIRNGLDLSAFGAETSIKMTLDVATKAGVAPDASAIGTDNMVFALEGILPKGVSFNGYTGAFSGTPVENGTFNVLISMQADGGWIQDAAIFTLTVNNDLFETSGLNGTVGAAFAGQVTSEALVEDGAKVVYTCADLPAGLSMDADGSITGTPAAAGTYNITVSASATVESTGSGSNPFMNSGNSSTTTDYTLHFTVEIAG